MPHLVLDGVLDCGRAVAEVGPEVHRWGRAVLKVEGGWLRRGGEAALFDGVVVELARPLHPVAFVARHEHTTVLRLWPLAPVERTAAVQRWLAVLAAILQRHGAGPVTTTNLATELLAGLDLTVASAVARGEASSERGDE